MCISPSDHHSFHCFEGSLRCTYICSELANFLIAHLETLEELVMTHCQCSLPLLAEDTEVMHWYEFFDALTEKQPSRLRKLEMTPARQIGEESLDEFDDEPRYRSFCDFLAVEPERGLCKKTRELQVEDPKRRLFTYANYDEDGRLTRDAKEELESLLKGEDQRAYDRLMAIVDGKKQRKWEHAYQP